MRNQEQDQWAAWSAEHPGERVLEVETGFMVENITHDISQPNLVMFDWYASKGGTLMVKVSEQAAGLYKLVYQCFNGTLAAYDVLCNTCISIIHWAYN